jgi:hypothetical protein
MSKEPSLEERLYAENYSRFEKDKKENGVYAERQSRFRKTMSYFFGGTALFFGASGIYDFVQENTLNRDMLNYSTAAVTATCFAMEAYNAMQIFQAMYKKNTGGTLTEEEKEKIKRTNTLRKNTFYAGSAIMVGSILGTIPPSCALFALPILIFGGYIVLKTDRSGYRAAVDYITDTKRTF